VESGPNVLGGLLVAFVLSFTVALSLILGVAAAYLAVNGIIHAFAYHSQRKAAVMPQVLVPSESAASGD
jgi:hypothetical protein